MRKQRFALMLLMQLGLVCVSGLHAQVKYFLYRPLCRAQSQRKWSR